MHWKFWKPKPEIHPIAQMVAGILACMCKDPVRREKLMTIYKTGVMPPEA